MLGTTREPLGRTDRLLEDYLPADWQRRARQDLKNGIMLPPNFGVVEPENVYRSGIPWAHQVLHLHETRGLAHVVSLIDGNWLAELYDHPDITLHQIPFRERRTLAPRRVRKMVRFLDELEGPKLVHCVEGEMRTGMLAAGYQVLHGTKTAREARKEDYLAYTKPRFPKGFRWLNSGVTNLSAMREILSYQMLPRLGPFMELATYLEEVRKESDWQRLIDRYFVAGNWMMELDQSPQATVAQLEHHSFQLDEKVRFRKTAYNLSSTLEPVSASVTGALHFPGGSCVVLHPTTEQNVHATLALRAVIEEIGAYIVTRGINAHSNRSLGEVGLVENNADPLLTL